MPRPRNADGQKTRQAILDAALDLFAEQGFFGTSLRDIAGAVGVRESALYNYFAGKDALFEELIVLSQEEKQERLQAIAADRTLDVRDALGQLASALLDSYQEPRQQRLFRVLLSDGIRLARQGRLNLLERFGSGGRGPLSEVLRRGVDQGMLRDADVTMMAVAFVSPLLMWRHVRAVDAPVPLFKAVDTFARLHVDQFLRGAATAAHTTSRSTPARRRARVRRPSARVSRRAS